MNETDKTTISYNLRDVPVGIWRAARSVAMLRGITIRDVILQALTDYPTTVTVPNVTTSPESPKELNSEKEEAVNHKVTKEYIAGKIDEAAQIIGYRPGTIFPTATKIETPKERPTISTKTIGAKAHARPRPRKR